VLPGFTFTSDFLDESLAQSTQDKYQLWLELARRAASRQMAKFTKTSAVPEMGDRLATIVMGRKVGATVSLFVGGAGFPSKTMSLEQRPTSVPSDILIHPTVWPQYINVICRQTDRTDRQTDRQTGQRSDSIGQTVTCNGRLQTVV